MACPPVLGGPHQEPKQLSSPRLALTPGTKFLCSAQCSDPADLHLLVFMGPHGDGVQTWGLA